MHRAWKSLRHPDSRDELGISKDGFYGDQDGDDSDSDIDDYDDDEGKHDDDNDGLMLMFVTSYIT